MLERYTGFSQVCGVGIVLLADGSTQISLCQVETNGSALEIVKKMNGLGSLEGLAQYVPASVPLSINLAGKGILTKSLSAGIEPAEDIFSRVLPGSNPEDFVVQRYDSGAVTFVSLLRETEAQRYIGQLSALGYRVLALSLGPFAVSQVLPQLNMYGPEVVFDSHRVERNEHGEWTAYRYESGALSEFPLKIESEPIGQELLLAYASAFQLALSNRLPLVQAQLPSLQSALDAATRNLKIRALSYAGLGLLFLLLLANFGLLSYLEQQNRELARNTSRSVQSSLDLGKLTTEIAANKALLDSLGWDGGISKAAIIDQISQLKPAEISLDYLVVNPVVPERSGVQKSLRFHSRLVIASGTSAKITEINEWVERIKSLPWARGARLQSYSYQPEKNTGQFSLEITYGNDPK